MIQRYVMDEYGGHGMPSGTCLTPVGNDYDGDEDVVCLSQSVAELEAQLPVPGTFAWAIVQVMKGLKIRRACWGLKRYAYRRSMRSYIEITLETGHGSDQFLPLINIYMINATDWEIAP